MAVDQDDDDVLEQLDSAITSIETHRDWRVQKEAEEAAQLEDTWHRLTVAAKKLRRKLAHDNRVRYFSISRDGNEISVSFHRGQRGASNMISMFRNHPEGKFPTTKAVWVRMPGMEDQRIAGADKAISTLVNFCARNMTQT